MAPGKPPLLKNTKDSLNLARLPDKVLRDVIDRPLRREARETRNRVVGRLMEPGAERMFKKPAFFPGDWLLIPLGVILCIAVVVASIGLFGLPKKAPVVESGPMPMGEKFEVAPNKETNPDTLPMFDGGLVETKKVFECRDVVSMFISTPGTLVIDNFTKKNIRVETPPSFPGLITLECNGKIGLSQTQLLAAPTIPVPTQFVTNTPVPTLIPTQQVEIQSTPIIQVFQQVPAPTSGQYSVVQVVHNGVPDKASAWAPIQNGSESYYSLVTTASCGGYVTLPLDKEIYALVDVNLPVYGPEVLGNENGVSIACDGYNSTILFVEMKK